MSLNILLPATGLRRWGQPTVHERAEIVRVSPATVCRTLQRLGLNR